MTTDSGTKQRALVEEAHLRLKEIAKGLVIKIGGAATADLFAGAAVSVLLAGHDRETVVEYLKQLADEVERDAPHIGYA